MKPERGVADALGDYKSSGAVFLYRKLILNDFYLCLPVRG
jgi:hypothetical protein